MQAVVLAAGKSSRFVPFTQTFAHKSLVKIMGKTILEHTLFALKKAEVSSVILVVNKKEAFEQVIGDGSAIGLKITYVVFAQALGMGAAILQAKEYLEEKFFVLNTNHVNFADFAKDMESKQQSKETVVLLGKKDNAYDKYGFMQVANDKIVRVVEKPGVSLGNDLRIIGIYLLTKAFIDVLAKTPQEHYSFETALDTYSKSHEVRFVQTNQPTVSLKYGWDLFVIKDYLLQKVKRFISDKAKIAQNAEIIGNVYIDDDATILEGACIKGPSFIGKNAFIGTNSLVRNNSSIEENAVVGSYLEIKNTLLMDRSTTHTGVIEDSIIGRGCKIAAGIITANVRLDRKNIFSIVKEEKVDTGLTAFGILVGDNGDFGVRVTTMPGVIIGQNVTIGPSTTVRKNIPENTKYFATFSDVVEEKKAS